MMNTTDSYDSVIASIRENFREELNKAEIDAKKYCVGFLLDFILDYYNYEKFLRLTSNEIAKDYCRYYDYTINEPKKKLTGAQKKRRFDKRVKEVEQYAKEAMKIIKNYKEKIE